LTLAVDQGQLAQEPQAMEDGASILFGLPGVAVDRIERFTDDGSAVRLIQAR
jgi:hypothetical protein